VVTAPATIDRVDMRASASNETTHSPASLLVTEAGQSTQARVESWVLRIPDGTATPLGPASTFDGVGPQVVAESAPRPQPLPDDVQLISITVIHPDAAALRAALDDVDLAAPVSVLPSETPRLIVTWLTSRGPVIVTGDGGELDLLTERQAALDLFHRTWLYLDRDDRSAAHDAAMVACAEASLWHWRRVGAATQWAIGEWQCSRVYAVLGEGELALEHAVRCRDIAEADRVDDFVPASAHEALARAHAVLGDFESAREERNIAYRLAVELDGEDRDVIEHDLGTIPIPLA
jgi:hypothetical protein